MIVSRQSSALFSDKEQLWVDNASSSPYFGYAYVCNVGFRSNGQGGAIRSDSRGTVYVFWVGTDIQTRQGVFFMARSTDGGKTFERPRVAATDIPDVGRFDPVTGRFTFDGVAGAHEQLPQRRHRQRRPRRRGCHG